jgi:hypothetical protein
VEVQGMSSVKLIFKLTVIFNIQLRIPPLNIIASRLYHTHTRIGMQTSSAHGGQGHSAKNWESGIWLKICKLIVIPEIEILHSRSLPIFPD